MDKLDNVDTGQGGCGLDCLQWRRETGVEKCIFSASDKLQCACYINIFVISVFGGCCSVIAFELTPITLIVCWGSVCWLETSAEHILLERDVRKKGISRQCFEY